jgi:hypothetical protein
MDLIEVRRLAPSAADADDGHAEQLGSLGKILGENAQADDDDGLAFEDRLVPLIPFSLSLVALHLPEIAVERDHVEEGKLAHLRAVDAAG